jgi:hypothetical protein
MLFAYGLPGKFFSVLTITHSRKGKLLPKSDRSIGFIMIVVKALLMLVGGKVGRVKRSSGKENP